MKGDGACEDTVSFADIVSIVFKVIKTVFRLSKNNPKPNNIELHIDNLVVNELTINNKN